MMSTIKKSGVFFLLILYSHFGASQHKNELAFEVIISEIFVNPSSATSLPEVEYVELYNRSMQSIQLKNWTFADKVKNATIETDFELAPKSYVILTKASSTNLFTSIDHVIGLTPFPDLNKDADELKLSNEDGMLIHQVNYFEKWYEGGEHDGTKSLEIIDPDNTCEGTNNWTSSVDPTGGTPGKINSVDGNNVDDVVPSVISINILNPNQIEVFFSESLTEAGLTSLSSYTLKDANMTYSISNIETCADQSNTCVIINLNENIAEGITVNLVVTNISDCAGNQISDQAFTFLQAAAINAQDVLINEVLFNTATDVEDFVELYNNSNKLMDLSVLIIEDKSSSTKIEFSGNFLFEPQAFVALTKDKQAIINYYQPPEDANIIEVEKLPDFNNDKDLIRILNKTGTVIDSLTYSEDWHFDLLGKAKGFSLERLDLTQPANQANNWQSAAATVKATPGYQNSQTITSNIIATELITIENTSISPDNDGFEDFLIIQYNTPSSGWIANLQIFDERGRFVTHLIKNELLGENGIFKWNGLDENEERIPLGIYIVYAEFFNEEGKVKKQKLPIIVSGKL